MSNGLLRRKEKTFKKKPRGGERRKKEGEIRGKTRGKRQGKRGHIKQIPRGKKPEVIKPRLLGGGGSKRPPSAGWTRQKKLEGKRRAPSPTTTFSIEPLRCERDVNRRTRFGESRVQGSQWNQ